MYSGDDESFLYNLLAGTEVQRTGYIVMNLIFKSKETNIWETKCMLYGIKETREFVRLVDHRLKGVVDSASYNDIRATADKKILIRDKEDLYGAILQHVRVKSTEPMEIYIGRDTDHPIVHLVDPY